VITLKTTYLRFVFGTNRGAPREQLGIIASLAYLKDADQLSEGDRARAEELLLWFESQLPCPPFSGRKYPQEAVSWFKASAVTMIAKAREVAVLLEEYDHPVRMLRTQQPGMILYEDDFQVIAKSRHF